MSKKHLDAEDEDISVNTRSVATNPNTPQTFSLSKQAAEKFSLDKTPLAPHPTTLLSVGQFESTYLKQLESLIYNDQDRLDDDALRTIAAISDIVASTHRPIRLMSQAYRKKLPTLCKVLNQFYITHNEVIRSISQQLST